MVYIDMYYKVVANTSPASFLICAELLKHESLHFP